MISRPPYAIGAGLASALILRHDMHAMTARDRTIVIGIDEAGYGPILGPLVVSAAGYEVSNEKADACLWDLLNRSVTRKAAARVAILDSKRLYQRKTGLARLERSVLSAVSAWRQATPRLRDLCELLCPDVLEAMAHYPWYRGANPDLPAAADADGIHLASAILRRDMAEQSIRPAGIWSEVLLEGHFNRLVGKMNNKAVVLFGLVLHLIHRVSEAYPDCALRIHIDKQGARGHYGALLRRAFEDRQLRIIEESDEYSAYELISRRTTWHVSFAQSGESKELTVAMASLVSKYFRELFMQCFNTFWSEHVAGLKPTAGYYEDGRRFLKDIAADAKRLQIGQNLLVRQR